MSTYLLAFVIGKLDYQEAITHDGVSVRAWATPDQSIHTTFALDVTVKSLEFFNDYFEIPYPLNKCDIVALPDFAAGAMENWGLLTFRETCMLVDPKNTSLDNQQYVAMVVAHEVAHQWFGNLVTMRWWNDLWLNEGFASWIEYMAVDRIFPNWHMWTQFIADEQHAAFRLDALINTHPIEVDVPDPDLIPTIFDGISYSKGASIIHMLHEYLGKNSFRLGLVHYLKKFSYKNTVTTDLWDALSEVSHLPVDKFMSAWTSNAGLPLVVLKLNGHKLKLNQQRFLASGKKIDSPIWPIPLLSQNLDKHVFDTANLDIDLITSDAIRLNNNQAGFYITKYWPEAYTNLACQIKENQRKETEKIGLLTDMLALTKAGHLETIQLLDVIKEFSTETSSPVWDSIAAALSDMRRILGIDVREALKPFTRQLIQNQLDRLSWQEHKNESHFDILLRPLILGLASGSDNEQVIKEALSHFKLAVSISDICPNLRNMIVASVSHRGSEKEYQIILNMYKTATSPEDKLILARGLTNFRNATQYNKSIKLLKSKFVRLQDVSYWIIYGLNNPNFRPKMWDWIKINWPWLKTNFSNDMVYPRLPVYIARSFNDNKSLLEFKEFFDKMHESSLNRGIKQGIETIETQIAWRKRDGKTVLDWLNINFD
ncbi:MAG: M1 family aminopeptidase [Candidatus Saccharibacteria bacterium]